MRCQDFGVKQTMVLDFSFKTHVPIEFALIIM